MSETAGGWDWDWTMRWTVVTFANAIVPGVLGFVVTLGGGTIGMIAGVFVVWGLGLGAVALPAWVRQAGSSGGVVVALTQFIPIVQIFAGLAALWTWDQIDTAAGGKFGGTRTELGGFAVTLMTAQLLLAVSFAFGAIPAWLVRKDDPASSDEAD